jgi:hypothetical protein
MTDDPFLLLAMPDDGWPPGVDLVMAAAKSFDPDNPSPLINLLESNALMTNRRGLQVFAKLGRRGAAVLDVALKLAGHPDGMARNALMDGVICYSQALNSSQASAILTLVDDPFPLVRAKVMTYLAHADLGSLEAAVASLGEPLRNRHLTGLDVLRTEHSNPQQLFDEAIVRDDIWSVYALASLKRMARKGVLTRAPEYSGESYMGNDVVAQVKILIARRSPERPRKFQPE